MIKDDLLFARIADYTDDMIIDLINHTIVGRNAQRNREIIKRRLVDGIYYEPLAEEFDLSVRQVQNIIYKAISKLLTSL